MTPDDRPDPNVRDARDELLFELASLTLPLMWALRQASVRALEPLGLRPIQGLALGMIAQGVDSPKGIADLLDLGPPMVSGLLGDLDKRGLIVRTPDPDDRRRVRLRLSPAGVDATERLTQLWVQVTRERLGHLGDDDLAGLLRIYRAFVGGP